MEKGTKEEKAIGVFDSGFGGLTILREIVKALPEYNYIYLGDTARTPYGTRSQTTIYKFTKQAINFLFEKGCDLVILACNSASSEALRRIQQELLPKNYPDKRVLGVIVPSSEVAVKLTATNKIGVMATSSTVASGAFVRELSKLNPKIEVTQQACPLFVPIIESGETDTVIITRALENCLNPLLDAKVDTIILGCTHYGILESEIRAIVGPDIRLVTEGRVIGEKLEEYLGHHKDIEKNLTQGRKVHFYTTDLTDSFSRLGSRFYGTKIQPEFVQLDYYT